MCRLVLKIRRRKKTNQETEKKLNFLTQLNETKMFTKQKRKGQQTNKRKYEKKYKQLPP